MSETVPQTLPVELPPLGPPGAPEGGSLVIAVPVRRSERARRITLRVKGAGEVELIAPPRAGLAQCASFLESQRGWLRAALQRVKRRRAAAPPVAETLAAHLAAEPWVSAGGARLAVEIAETRTKRPCLVYRAGAEPVVLRHRGGGLVEDDLKALLRGFAARTLPARAAELSARTGVSAGAVSVRDQRGRWGSCAAAGGLSLNWRLALLPPELQDHVILHELAHRLEMNHSQRFWDVLARWDPDWNANDRALNRQWGWLMRLGR